MKRSGPKTPARALGTAAVMLLGLGCSLGLLARTSTATAPAPVAVEPTDGGVMASALLPASKDPNATPTAAFAASSPLRR